MADSLATYKDKAKSLRASKQAPDAVQKPITEHNSGLSWAKLANTDRPLITVR